MIDEKSTTDILAGARMMADNIGRATNAEALFALKGDMVEALDLAADFIALQARVVAARPALPTFKGMVLSLYPPSVEGREDGTTWADLASGRLMVLKNGQWLDPADGVNIEGWTLHRPEPVKSSRASRIEFALDRLSYVLAGALIASIIFN